MSVLVPAPPKQALQAPKAEVLMEVNPCSAVATNREVEACDTDVGEPRQLGGELAGRLFHGEGPLSTPRGRVASVRALAARLRRRAIPVGLELIVIHSPAASVLRKPAPALAFREDRRRLPDTMASEI